MDSIYEVNLGFSGGKDVLFKLLYRSYKTQNKRLVTSRKGRVSREIPNIICCPITLLSCSTRSVRVEILIPIYKKII